MPERPEAPTGSVGRVAGLDGLRGLAILLVLLLHFRTGSLVPGGWVGVDLFFVLSGYLITWTLLDEHRRTGGIRLGGFYRRRLRRLGPAASVFLAVWAVVALLAGHQHWFTGHLGAPTGEYGPPLGPAAIAATLLAAFSLSANWWVIAAPDLFPLPHLWSLAVEEQFYLVWPPLLAVLAGRRRLLATAAAVGAVASAVVAFVVNGSSHSRISFGTDARVQALFLGALLAIVHLRATDADGVLRRPPSRTFRRTGHAAVAVLLGAAAVLHPVDAADRGMYTAIAVIATIAVAATVFTAGPTWLASAPLRWLGRRSYALYLWHYPIAVCTRDLGWPGTVAGFVLAVVAADASWRLLERRLSGPRTGARPNPIFPGLLLRVPS